MKRSLEPTLSGYTFNKLPSYELDTSVPSGFERQKEYIIRVRKAPITEITTFHITEQNHAEQILKSGFRLKYAKNLAFGRGINLCDAIEDTIPYIERLLHSNKTPALIICKTLVSKSHETSSDVNTIITDDDGNTYSKPQDYRPMRGFDSMYVEAEHGKIWIIPSRYRVVPVEGFIVFKN
jgi:hypothetical protein